ncbi:MAG: glycosyltransferase family 4 protein, partial [Methylococcales bacterium]
IVQNTEDRILLIDRMGIPANRVALIRGSGVDIRKFYPMPEPPGSVSIALVSRMLWDKGVGEFVAAIGLLKQRGIDCSAVLVGEPDDENLTSVGRVRLRQWHDAGLIDWRGYCADIAEIWHNTHIAVLPAYREGLPKSLLEAAACGRPIVTTHTSGCKEIVRHGVNGFLVPVRDARALADALETLIQNPALRQTMGRAGRAMVEQDFSDERVIAATLGLYEGEFSCDFS